MTPARRPREALDPTAARAIRLRLFAGAVAIAAGTAALIIAILLVRSALS